MIPAFPVDATIMSIHLACLHVGRSATLGNGQPRTINNRYGHKAQVFVTEVLNGTMSAENLIERHSLFPYFSSLLTPEATNRWRDALIAGDKGAFHHYLPGMTRVFGFGYALRQCVSCVEQDREDFGVGHWRVAHQLPSIRFCQLHQLPLQDHCNSCKNLFDARSGTWLPSAPCPVCGVRAPASRAKSHCSAGYQAYASLVTRTLSRSAPELAPNARHRLMLHLIDTARSGGAELLRVFLDWWDVRDLTHLGDLLETPIDESAANLLFETGLAQVGAPFLLSVLAFAWEHTNPHERSRLLHNNESALDMFSDQAYRYGEDVLLDSLASIAAQLYLPYTATWHLSQGNRKAAVALVGSTNVFLLLEGLSPELREAFRHRTEEYAECIRSSGRRRKTKRTADSGTQA